jgi:hypothetical protein
LTALTTWCGATVGWRRSLVTSSLRFGVRSDLGCLISLRAARVADAEAPPLDGRHADLVKKIKSARWSKKRTQLLMSLLR